MISKSVRVEKNYSMVLLTKKECFKSPLSKAKVCMRKNCQVCMDFTSELSDISVGSVGSSRGMVHRDIVRTEKGFKLLKS